METHTRLKSWLNAAKVTPAELARRCGYDRSNFNRILQGKAKPSLPLAVRIERETAGVIPAIAWVPATEQAA